MVKKKWLLLFSPFWVLIFLNSSIDAAYTPNTLNTETPARVISLGSALNAAAYSAEAIFGNPANLSDLGQPNLTSLFHKPYENTTVIVAGWQSPVFLGGRFGLGLRNATAANVVISSETGSVVNQDLSLAYGRQLLPRLSVGLALRLLSRQVGSVLSGSGIDCDIGLRFQPTKWLLFSALVQNISASINYNRGSPDIVPANNYLGATIKLRGQDSFWAKTKDALLMFVDYGKNNIQPIGQAHLGLEWQPIKTFALRCGLDQTPNTATENSNNLTMGFGLNLSNFTFDYAYKNWALPAGTIRHYFSLGYAWPEPKVKTKPITAEAVVSQEVVTRQHFSDIKEDYWAKEPVEVFASLNFLRGYPDKTIRPENTITPYEISIIMQRIYDNPAIPLQQERKKKLTRAQGIVMINQSLDIVPVEVEEAPFQDVGGRYWAAKEITAAKQAGLLKYFDKKLEPDKDLTRAEAAAILYQSKPVQEKLARLRFQ